MKSTVLMFFFSLASVAYGAKGIIVQQRYTSASTDAKMTVTWYVADGLCKMKMEFGSGSLQTATWFIPDAKTSRLLSYTEGAPLPEGVIPTYFSLPVEKISASKEADVRRVSVEKSGETKEIMGFNCEKITIKSEKAITEMWVTRDIKAEFYKFYPFFRSSTELLGLYEERFKGVPLQSVTLDLSGKELSRYELIKAEQFDLSESDFRVPAQYKPAGTN